MAVVTNPRYARLGELWPSRALKGLPSLTYANQNYGLWKNKKFQFCSICDTLRKHHEDLHMCLCLTSRITQVSTAKWSLSAVQFKVATTQPADLPSLGKLRLVLGESKRQIPREWHLIVLLNGCFSSTWISGWHLWVTSSASWRRGEDKAQAGRRQAGRGWDCELYQHCASFSS